MTQNVEQAAIATPEISVDGQGFTSIWFANNLSIAHPATEAGFRALDKQLITPEAAVSEVRITDVTLRDGQQQQTNTVSTEERIEVFDQILSTGVDCIEIGHLGNKKGDQQLAVALVRHLAEKEEADPRYKDVKLQVLFGSKEKEIQEGSQVLRDAFIEHYPDTWQEEMAERVVVHVYDRVDPNLRSTASEPYSMQESAYRVALAAAHAQGAGFRQFSISGEATTAINPNQAIQFYRSITTQLVENGADAVNVNLPNTYGYSHNPEWNTASLAIFNAAVKQEFENKVTTSIHAHNDVDNAVSFTISAIVAGFDRVEGTPIGLGERTGNVATIDVIARLLEQARHQVLREERQTEKFSSIAQYAGRVNLQRTVRLDPNIIDNLRLWHPVGNKLADIFGPHAIYRWHRTAVGNPYAHDNGSGPHDQAMATAITDPVKHPGDSHYEWALLINSVLGRPDTEEIAIGNPHAVDKITVGNHAGGGKTIAIKQGSLKRAPPHEIDQARAEFRFRKQELVDALRKGVLVVSG